MKWLFLRETNARVKFSRQNYLKVVKVALSLRKILKYQHLKSKRVLLQTLNLLFFTFVSLKLQNCSQVSLVESSEKKNKHHIIVMFSFCVFMCVIIYSFSMTTTKKDA